MKTDQSAFLDIKRYTFGTMSLGSDLENVEAHVAVARQAMEAGVWFHASPTYNRGFCFMILRMAFDQERSKTPRMIIKIRDTSPQLLRFEVEDACRRLGLEGIDCIQLVAMKTGEGGVGADIARGGAVCEAIQELRERGMVRACELFLREEDAGVLEKAWPSGVLDAVTFYWNVAQRSCSDRDWESVKMQNIPVLALRTLAGGGPQADKEDFADKLEQWIADVGCSDWTELNMRYAASVPNMITTIGGTANPNHLERFLECSETARPFDAATLERIEGAR